MSQSAAGLPDYDRLAATFDRHLPLIGPVGTAILDHLPALPDGALVLDVACGTGEPGLTLARRQSGVRLLGTDPAGGMIDLARAKATRENLGNARFETAPAEKLPSDDAGVDAVISRFGLLFFGDIPASAEELARVLRPGGSFCVAVWDDMTRNTLTNTVFTAARPRVAPELVRPFDRLSEFAGDEQRENLLRKVGMSEVESEWFQWHMEFPSQDALTGYFSGPGLFEQLTAKDGEAIRAEVLAALATYRQPDGSYHIPHACRVLWGRR